MTEKPDTVTVVYPGPAVEKSAGQGSTYFAAFDLELRPGLNEIPTAAAEALLRHRIVRVASPAPAAAAPPPPRSGDRSTAAPDKPPASKPARGGRTKEE